MGDTAEHAEGAGPFTTRLTRPLATGGTSVWESRAARKRGVLTIRPRAAATTTRYADEQALRRLRILNAVVAASFVIGGALFVLGAVIVQFALGDTTESATVFFVGGIFFCLGAYTSLLQVSNAPRPGDNPEVLVTHRWRWWRYEPLSIDWLSAFVLLVGTLEFGVNLIDSFLEGLTVQQMNRLVWAPDIIGCLLFLVSGHLALAEVCHGRLHPIPRDLGWWIAAVNQFGSVLFLVAAIAEFTNPGTHTLVNASVVNWGTLTGAGCFVAGGFLQFFERPVGPAAASAAGAAAG